MGTLRRHLLSAAAMCLIVAMPVRAGSGDEVAPGNACGGTPYDIDANGSIAALTDGLLAVRHMFGLSGSALVQGAIGAGATRSDPAVVKTHLQCIPCHLDPDGSGGSQALSDGLLLLRYFFGLRDAALAGGAVGAGCTRCEADPIEAFIAAPTCTVCGDGTCEGGETPESCQSDCSVCGDGLCDSFEDEFSCPADCEPTLFCGDGLCSAGEDFTSCPEDCEPPAECGDGFCEPPENQHNCAADCGIDPL
jgi:hypothetical protein